MTKVISTSADLFLNHFPWVKMSLIMVYGWLCSMSRWCHCWGWERWSHCPPEPTLQQQLLEASRQRYCCWRMQEFLFLQMQRQLTETPTKDRFIVIGKSIHLHVCSLTYPPRHWGTVSVGSQQWLSLPSLHCSSLSSLSQYLLGLHSLHETWELVGNPQGHSGSGTT